ncbi:MAG: YggS family pyridoxal phosphate-dependent enzyme, partial [Gemmatimonadetes bacterium]|nr:YggS family pyridoxal phosphate-dependent enzyme [Gemmatimonadota bacterium]NIR79975.1 YggS family pyridoxal phosphate-dependent enzyme [Gemmatimonadota bacterium]NIT88706.1 YggS family pyridoxal phosphate-dependent enzyme [Gemmatimonadota bacterium]NIU32513.1 YggS family pyridoxal phosphate-dependent enzyme [Gemmatimonadota bacterium]NIV62874.1 YggS family pyridoxal phosphate-dependent enzyme [Gemmatimonadota bacterium]
MSYRTRLEETLPRVRETIAEAARRAGREPEEVRIVPVTKGHPLEAV